MGLAVGGSWLTNEIDEYSDLDLVLVTREKITNDKSKMMTHAQNFGKLLCAFTGEHVGEPRVLICLYDEPLLHVDLKFVTLGEFQQRVENPVILFDRLGQLLQVLQQTQYSFPHPDFQWIEDRFWIWVHYALLKIGRGEYFEALDFFGFLRTVVLGPLLHLKNGNLPRGVRKVETQLESEDLDKLLATIASYNKTSLLEALDYSIALYRELRSILFEKNVRLQNETEEKVLEYLVRVKAQPNS